MKQGKNKVLQKIAFALLFSLFIVVALVMLQVMTLAIAILGAFCLGMLTGFAIFLFYGYKLRGNKIGS